MADYDRCNRGSINSSSMDIAVSSSQGLPSSTTESMWEGWSQASPVSPCTLSEQIQEQLGGGYTSTTNPKSGSSYQHDLLSSWLMSGYQTVSLSQQQQQQLHGGQEGSGVTSMYQDEFSRMNICSPAVSSDYHVAGHVVPSPSVAAAGTGGGSDNSHQFYDVIQTCSSKSGHPNEVGESSQFLGSPPSPDHHKFTEAPAHKLDRKIVHQMNATTELSSRASSSSPPSGLNSYGQTMQQQLGGQFDSSAYWASSASTAAVTSSSPQPSDCSGGDRGGGGGVMRTSGQQREDQQQNTISDSIILHHQQQHSPRKNRCEGEGDDTFFHNSGTDLSADQMYTELHGLLSKSPETPAHPPAHGGAVDSHHQPQLGSCSDGTKSPAAGSYGDHSRLWSQFTVNANFPQPSTHAGAFMGIQEVVDRTTFDSNTAADSLRNASRAATRRDELSPSSAGTAMSAVHNFRSGGSTVASDLTASQLPYRASSSSAADMDYSDMGVQRKRPPSRVNEQMGENGVSAADDSAKRSRIVRCLWEQNIAQLQLANLPSERQRNLWQLQSQALFGRLPGGNFLIGGSSGNSGSMDMTTAVGPALNTNGRPRARRGSATDPQSVYARHRRERINDRLKVLQHLVPNGAKVDIVTMLEEAINYVKFLQLQVRLLSSDELWIYAPTTYNGVDVSMGMHTGLLNQPA